MEFFSNRKVGKVVGAVSAWVFGIFSASVTYAAQQLESAPQVSISSVGGILCLIESGFDLMFWFLIAIAAVMVIVAAYGYLTSSGDAEKVGKATKTITYAAIAVAVALIAREIPAIVGSFFGVTGLSQNTCAS